MTSSLPTAQPPETSTGGRPRRRRWLAAILASALALGGSITATAPAFADGAPTVTATEAPREGGTVTVTGSGFSPAEPGVYLGIAPSSATGGFYQSGGLLLGSETVWVGPGNEDGVSDAGRTAKLQADGSFSVDVTIPAFSDDVPGYVVLTSKAHGQGFSDPSQDVRAEIAYVAAEEPGTEEPGTEEPGTEEPGTEEPGTEEPGTEEPGTEEPGTEEPGTEEPGTEEPGTEEPDTEEPGTEGPGTEEPGTEEPGTEAPTVVVSKTTGLDPHGETVTITGSGFVPDGAATTGTRPPLAGKFTGAYVAFGAFADDWAPSTGAAGSTRPTADVKWGVHEADLATIGGAAKGGIVIAEDGTFETTLTVSYDYAGALADGNYGIYTYPGGGAKNAEFESFTPISFKPGVFVSKTQGLDPFGDTVTVKGVGFTQSAETTAARPPLAGRFGGAYVAFGAFAEGWAPSTGAAAATRPTGDVKWGVHEADLGTIGGAAGGGIVIAEDGTFETELHVSADYEKLAVDGDYGIYTYPGGGAKYAPFETATAISFAPNVTVSKTSGLDPDGETVTVRGAGFLPAGAATTGTRPPLAGKFTGAYVVFGSFADGWQPSTGGAASLRKADAQKWAVQQGDLATIGGANAGGIVIGKGGSFETTLTVREFEGALENGRYGVYTYPGGGAKHAPFETATLVDFAEPAPVIDPQLTVTPSTNVDSTVANTFTVSGTGYVGDGAKNGAYVLLGADDIWTGDGPLVADGWLVQAWVMPGQIKDGAFTTTLTVPAGKFDPTKGYVVASSAAHGLSVTDRSLDAFAPITVAPVVEPKLTVTPSTDVDPTKANTFTVSGTGYIGAGAASGVYVLLGADDIWTGDGPLVADGWLVQAWVTPAQIKDGKFTTTLTVPAGKFDPTKGYVAASSAAHGLSVTDRSLDAFAPITIAEPATTGPKLTVTPSKDIDGTVSNTFTVSGTGYIGAGAASGVYVLLGADDIWTGDGPLVADGWLAQAWVTPAQIKDGKFTTTLTVPAGKFDAGKRYVAASSAAHGLSAIDRSLDAFAPITVATGTVDPVEPTEPGIPVDPSKLKLTVSPSKDLDGAKSNVLTVKGAGYTGKSAAQGVYLVFGEKSVWAGEGPLPADGWIALEWVSPDQISKGAFTAKITVPAGKLDAKRSYVVASSAAHGLSQTDRTLDAFASVTVKAGIKPDPTKPTTPTTPTTPPVVSPGPVTNPGTIVSGGSLTWGVDDDFVRYIGGTIAKGSISVSGATRSGGVFQFGQSGGSYDAGAGRGSAEYSGSVNFTGHGGVLDLTFADPVLRVTSPQSGVLSVAVNGSRVDLASVDLGAASRSTTNGATRFADAPVTLLATGVPAFNGFYGAGRALAPLTAVIGSPAAAPAGDSGTVVTAAATRSTTRDIPATPPATTGIVLDTATLEALGAGEVVSVTAGGFEPGEEDVAAVVYSTPIVLADDLSADAAGNVTWTGSIPASLEPGVHTLTFQGSTNVGVQFTVPAEKAGVCKVSAGDLDWGFKESFRSYLTSGIANGDWTLAGVTEDGGVFAFTGATGSLDESGRGVVAYRGTIEFTGHDGALDTTIADPKIELDGKGGAILLLDVAGTTQDGEPIDLKSVRFAELGLADGVTLKDGVLAGEATAVLTEDGAAAFGTYPAGEELDPVSFTATAAGDCVVTAPAVAESSDSDEVEAEATTGGDSAAAATDASQTGPAWWIWALIAALLVILLAVIAVIVIRARRPAEQG